MLTTIPDLHPLVEPILGAPYVEYPCWTLVRHLLRVGLDLDIVTEAERAAELLGEVWFKGDARDPLALSRPWDLWIMRRHGLVSEHVGLVVDATLLVHTRRRTGVVIEPLRRWLPSLLQIARLRVLQGVV